MSQIDRFVARLFAMPGDHDRPTESLLRRAATAHEQLLVRAAAEPGHAANSLLPAIASRLEHLAPALKRRFLVDPAFVEGLHRAISISRVLSEWHRSIAQPSIAKVGPSPTRESAHRLGNSLLALLLREDAHWCGRIGLRTDVYGRLRFPLSDWSIALSRPGDGTACVLSDELVTASLQRDEIRLSLGAGPEHDLLIVPRQDLLRMIVANDLSLDGRRIGYPSSDVIARLQFAGSLPAWRVRYEPVRFSETGGHFDLTGGIIAAALGAARRHSPGIAKEIESLISCVRGWELPAADYGTIQSFSDPTLPRVMGINVPYSADDVPCISPFCFTWFGHELGHTKSYLIETILHVGGAALCENPADYTEVIERYGRALSLRTVLQIPYTHLYEWVLLMDFLSGRFAALPWKIDDDPVDFGDEIHSEIVEAFDRIENEAQLTPCGHAAASRLQELTHRAQARWQRQRRQHAAGALAASALPGSRRSVGGKAWPN